MPHAGAIPDSEELFLTSIPVKEIVPLAPSCSQNGDNLRGMIRAPSYMERVVRIGAGPALFVVD